MPDGQGDETVIDAASDTRLRQAFETRAAAPGTEVSDELRDRIWLAVSGELPPSDRRALVDRMASDAACAEAWRAAHELWQASRAHVDVTVTPDRMTRWPSNWLLVAATFLIATTIGVVSLFNGPPADEFRASPGYIVSSLVQAETLLPRDGFRLQWTPGPEGSHYRIRVTTDDLQVLATASDLTVAEFVVQPAALARVTSGSSVFWQVEVTPPTGERLTSSTFIARVQ
jgi:hypothetical protein